MATSIGRNQICPLCDSNKKYKKCCALKKNKMSLSMRLSITAISVFLLGGMIIFLTSLGEIDTAFESAAPGRVWSEEHGHWH